MSSQSSLSDRFKRPSQSIQTRSNHSMFNGHHATVDCPECHRIMVPRVITYYGQPTKSICPFCGATFARFQGGFQKLLSRFQSPRLTTAILNKLFIITLGFSFLWLISDQISVSGQLSLIAFFGVALFGAALLAEILFQGIEYLAVKFSHDSKHYWLLIVMLSITTMYLRDDMIGYIGVFFLILVLRGLIVGALQLLRPSR